MKSLQDQYNLIKEGKGSEESFNKTAKRMYPNFVHNSSNYEQTVEILKYRNIIFEPEYPNSKVNESVDPFKAFKKFVNEAKESYEEATEHAYNPKDLDNIDNLYGTQFMNAMYTEAQDPKNFDKTIDELKKIVASNLKKDRMYYTKNSVSGVKGFGFQELYPIVPPKGNYKSSGYGDLKRKSVNESKKTIKENYGYFDDLEDAEIVARYESEGGYSIHINKLPSGGYEVSDWYDSDNTVATYGNGEAISESLSESRTTFSNREAAWFTGTSMCRVKHPEYGGHRLTAYQVKYSPASYKNALYKNMKAALDSGQVDDEDFKEGASNVEESRENIKESRSIYEIPDSIKDMFEQGEASYKIVDYNIPDMDNIESMRYFLEIIGATEDNIETDDGTQVVVKHPNFNHKLVIDSGGLGDFYSHGFDVSLFEE